MPKELVGDWPKYKIMQLSGTIKNGTVFVTHYFDWEGDGFSTGPVMNRLSVDKAVYKDIKDDHVIVTTFKKKWLRIGDELEFVVDRDKDSIVKKVVD